MTVLYEDALVIASLPEVPMTKGHIIVQPKNKAKAFSDLSEEEIEHLFYTASYGATALFEYMSAAGTNIIADESDDGIVVHVLARFPDDGLNFMWEPQPGDFEQIKATAKSIKDKVDEAAWARDNPDQVKKANTPKESVSPEEISAEDGEDNYLLKSLRRVP